jgi:hypothetical protein
MRCFTRSSLISLTSTSSVLVVSLIFPPNSKWNWDQNHARLFHGLCSQWLSLVLQK